MAPKGVDAIERFKSGKYSKYLPRNLRERYELFLSDPERDAMGNEIALLDVRLSMLAEGIETNEWGTATWKKMYRHWSELMAAIRSGDAAQQAVKITEIDDFLSDTSQHNTVWDDIERVSDVRRKCADSEHRRMEKMQRMITIEQAMVLVNGLINTLRDSVILYADKEQAGLIIDAASQAYYELVGGEPDFGPVDTTALTRRP